MAGHRRTRKQGAPTTRERHHRNAKAQVLARLEETRDPMQRLRVALGYVAAAYRRSTQRGRTTTSHHTVAEAVEAAVRALVRCGDTLLDPSKKGR